MRSLRNRVDERVRSLNPVFRRMEEGVPDSQIEWRGAAKEIQFTTDETVFIEGPAGTGKTRACLQRMHSDALRFPKSRQLICRKTRESMSETVLVTFETAVLPILSPVRRGPQRRNRAVYNYPNGSQIVIGGLDKPEKIMSGEYDRIYIAEATEATENDSEMLTTRLRWGHMPFQQLMMDANPSFPQHWLNQKASEAKWNRLLSRLEDNPRFFDIKTKTWTSAGAAYVGKLDELTGARYLRLRLGKWAAAEGVVYDSFDRAIHVIPRFEIPPEWPRYWAVDFGFTNPFVWKAYAQDPDGNLYRYREIYRIKTLVEDHARLIKQVTAGEPEPELIITDHDAEDRATFEKYIGLLTVPAHKSVSDGIQAVQARLRVQPNGKPRIFYLEDSLVERDPELAEARHPLCTEDEFDVYVWKEDPTKGKGEEPVKKWDHGMDADRYLIATLDIAGGYTLTTSDEAHQRLHR